MRERFLFFFQKKPKTPKKQMKTKKHKPNKNKEGLRPNEVNLWATSHVPHPPRKTEKYLLSLSKKPFFDNLAQKRAQPKSPQNTIKIGVSANQKNKICLNQVIITKRPFREKITQNQNFKLSLLRGGFLFLTTRNTNFHQTLYFYSVFTKTMKI